MGNSTVNSPNSTFENEDTIKLNSSIISSLSNSNGNNFNFGDQIYQFENVNTPFNPLPPPPISINTSYNYKSTSTPSSNHISTFTNPDAFQQNEFSLPNLSHYSVFSNQNAMNSANSLHNEGHQGQIFKLNIDSTSDILNDYSVSHSQNSDLMYNITEFELGNSLESIPDSNTQGLGLTHPDPNHFSFSDSSHHISQISQPSHHHLNNSLNFHPSEPHFNDSVSLHNISTHDVIQYPYTPTISDIYTPTLSETSSFTPNTSFNNITNNTTFLSEDYNIRAPMPILIKSHSFANITPTSNRILKKPSMSRLNSSLNKKNSLITAQVHSSNNTPLGESSPQLSGVSPLCYKYKDLDIYNQPSPIGTRSFSNCSTSSSTSITTPNKNLMPPLNTFRHNSDSSSCSSHYSETPKRKNYQKSGKTYPTNYSTVPEISTKKASRKTTKITTAVDDESDKETSSYSKQMKHTRRRLLPRSKNGCWICRIKHLKCDEARPVCTSCSKFGIECDYSPVKPGYVLDKNLRKEKLIDISILRKQKPISKIQPGHKQNNGQGPQQQLVESQNDYANLHT